MQSQRLLVWLFIMHCANQKVSGAASTTVICSGRGELARHYDISCAIQGAIISAITWTRPDNTPVIQCTPTHSCSLLVSGYRIVSKSNTSYVLQIDSVKGIDAGAWTCRDGAGDVNRGCNMTVLSNENNMTCSISRSSMTLTVDLKGYFCSEMASFELKNSNGKSCSLKLETSSPRLVDNTATCNITDDWRGTVSPVMTCGRFTADLPCHLSLDMSGGSVGGVSSLMFQTGGKPGRIVTYYALLFCIVRNLT